MKNRQSGVRLLFKGAVALQMKTLGILQKFIQTSRICHVSQAGKPVRDNVKQLTLRFLLHEIAR
jgi:vacuolar-type H+-ATPase catalytic subunit A/Vma1